MSDEYILYVLEKEFSSFEVNKLKKGGKKSYI